MCSWNNFNKGDPNTLGAWLRVLRRLPRAKLWLMLFDPSPPPNVALAAKQQGGTRIPSCSETVRNMLRVANPYLGSRDHMYVYIFIYTKEES